ncbi:ent-copalyl diphosphate synthase 5-like isoform X2 [Henckelia pumila]|uniref:ent-copalyl diphosphate synthase 5-like isoform X2 n=1 Tax=Henckelia pumila TaxID=405737 RepID=UPI003C6E577D
MFCDDIYELKSCYCNPYESRFSEYMAPEYATRTRQWTDKGICWARNTVVQDIDDTAMGFRLLRLYRYQVSSGQNHFLM